MTHEPSGASVTGGLLGKFGFFLRNDMHALQLSIYHGGWAEIRQWASSDPSITYAWSFPFGTDG